MKIHDLVIVSVAAMVSLAAAQDPVRFADVNLKAAIEDTLWISNPTPVDLLDLTELRAIGKGISDLAGLDFAVNLQAVYLRNNLINNI